MLNKMKNFEEKMEEKVYEGKKQNVNLSEDERVDDLIYKNLKIVQNKKLYSFTSDAVLLANFVKMRPKDVYVDLCSGSGIVAILASAKNNVQKTFAVEIQECLSEMSKKSVLMNDLENKIEVLNTSVQKCVENFEKHSVEVVSVNPPYRKMSEHFVGSNEHLNICNYEVELCFEDICKTANYLLKWGGKLFLVADSSRFVEICNLLKKWEFEPKEVQFIYGTFEKNSNVFLMKAVKNGKSGVLILPPKINL